MLGPSFRYIPLIILCLWGFICVGLRLYLHQKQTGKSGIAVPSDPKVRMLGYSLFTFIFLLFIPTIEFAFFPDHYDLLMFPFHGFETTFNRLYGIVFSLMSIGICAVAQAQMRESWRIGIDSNEKTELVQSGIFSTSRNPIYLGMVVGVFGLFIMMPSVFMLILFIAMIVTLEMVIREEEKYLEEKHGQAFVDYRNKVPRWF